MKYEEYNEESVGPISVTLEIDAPLLQKLRAPPGCFAEGGLDNGGDCLQLHHHPSSRRFFGWR